MADNWQDRAKELRQERVQQDHDDLNHEMGGRDVERIKRFVSPESIGDEATAKDDAAIQLLSDMALQEQLVRQERLQAAYDKFERYDRALDRAIAHSEQELQEALLHRQNVYDNGTKLSGDLTAFIDEESGHFYDEHDNRLNEADEKEARAKYKIGDSTHKQQNNADELAAQKTEKLKKFVTKKEELREKRQELESDPDKLNEIEAELEELDRDDELKAFMDNKSQAPAEPLQKPSTSVSKSVDGENGIKSELALTPAWKNAGGFEQVSTETVQKPEPDNISPKTSPELTIG